MAYAATQRSTRASITWMRPSTRFPRDRRFACSAERLCSPLDSTQYNHRDRSGEYQASPEEEYKSEGDPERADPLHRSVVDDDAARMIVKVRRNDEERQRRQPEADTERQHVLSL